MYKDSYHIKDLSDQSSNLPLSWTNCIGKEELSIIKIGRKSIWLNSGSFNNTNDFATSITNLTDAKNIIIRGCNKSVSDKLSKDGYKSTLFAKEAIIELNKEIKFSKKFNRRIGSLLKRGCVKEVVFSNKNATFLNDFLKSTIHWKKPKLRNLFLDELNEKTRLFVYEIYPNKWEGAILVSQNSKHKIQGEQFFRKRDGLNGVMDTIVYQICKTFKNEGYREFSLGETPFIIAQNSTKLSKTNILHFIGKRIKFAYNYEGLHYFKNKYATRWDDLFICSKGKLHFWDLFKMAKESNLLALLLYKAFR